MSKPYSNFNRKQIDFEDDLVIVFDENNKRIYKGIEDYEPMKDEPWKWDNAEQVYRLDEYVKVCLDI